MDRTRDNDSTEGVKPGIIPQSVNPLLQRERDRATLTKDLIAELTYMLDGGRDQTERRRLIESSLFADPLFSERDRYIRTSAETFDIGVRRSIRMINFKKVHNITFSEFWDFIHRALCNDLTSSGHEMMFVTFIESQATEEQRERWLGKARNMQMLGTYAQTELGHGTYVRGLETTATYVPSTQEFVLTTPSLTSMKWWPGALGKTSTHAIVMAQLIIGGRSYGPHAFMVQLRSLSDHSVLPGRKVGVIGDKWNFGAIDNGFLGLDNVRIPRKDMFMKYFQVAPDGSYSKQGSPKVIYSTMMFVRLRIVQEAWTSLARSLVIAIRFSAVRQQGPLDQGDEVAILDYQTQQEKLLPGPAVTYAFNAIGRRLLDVFNKVQADIAKEDFSSLSELHALTSGLKAYTTEMTSHFINVARFACGGHGFLLSSGLPDIYSRASATCTYEGENTVMYLLKSALAAQQGRAIGPSVAYLIKETMGCTWKAQSERDVLDPGLLVQAFRHRAYRLVNQVGEHVASLLSHGQSSATALSSCSVDLVRVAKAHIQFYTVATFFDVVGSLSLDPTLVSVLGTLSRLYAVYLLDQNVGDFLEDGYLNANQAQMVHHQYLALLASLRPEAVPLVDAFDFSDQAIHSVLGCYDGNIYERLYEHALRDPKNKTEIHETYGKYLRPLLTGNQSKL